MGKCRGKQAIKRRSRTRRNLKRKRFRNQKAAAEKACLVPSAVLTDSESDVDLPPFVDRDDDEPMPLSVQVNNGHTTNISDHLEMNKTKKVTENREFNDYCKMEYHEDPLFIHYEQCVKDRRQYEFLKKTFATNKSSLNFMNKVKHSRR